MESEDGCESYPISIVLSEEMTYCLQYLRQSIISDGDSLMDSSENDCISQSSSNVEDLEEDALVAENITIGPIDNVKIFIIDTAYLKHYSKSGSKPFVYSEQLKKLFCQLNAVDEVDTSILRVQHRKQEHELGDEFGAKISSKEYYIKKDQYFKHVFIKIKQESVASEINLVKGDELVLLNSSFMPHLSHGEVLDRFKHLSVDSKEKMSLVIRRSVGDWPWISISAHLVSTPGEDPIAKDIQATFTAFPPTTPIDSLLVLENEHGVCMLIENKEIGTWNLQNNSSDNKAVVSIDCILKIDKDGCLSHVATIKKEENGYIFVDTKNFVCLNEEKGYEFIFRASGELRMFKHQESGKYLGYKDSNIALCDIYNFVMNPPKNYNVPSIPNLSEQHSK